MNIIKTNSGFDRELTVRSLVKELGDVMRKHLDEATRTCINCERFDEKTEICKFYVPHSRPPARVIISGCVNHKDLDDIPF